MKREDAQRLLERVRILRHPCDLDLLLFFARHPRAIITSEQLAVWLGYELKQIADSLDVLLDAGVLTRTQNPTHAARMYVFAIGGTSGGWLPSLLALASTREGRLVLVEALSGRASKHSDGPTLRHARDAALSSRARPVVVRRNRDQGPDTMAG
jgi:hypothetical protein